MILSSWSFAGIRAERPTEIHFGNATNAAVSVWYRLRDNESRPLWYLQARTAQAHPRMWFYFHWSDLAARLNAEVYDHFLVGLCQLDCFSSWLRPMIDAGTHPSSGSIDLVDLAVQDEAVDQLVMTLGQVIDQPG